MSTAAVGKYFEEFAVGMFSFFPPRSPFYLADDERQIRASVSILCVLCGRQLGSWMLYDRASCCIRNRPPC